MPLPNQITLPKRVNLDHITLTLCLRVMQKALQLPLFPFLFFFLWRKICPNLDRLKRYESQIFYVC